MRAEMDKQMRIKHVLFGIVLAVAFGLVLGSQIFGTVSA